MNKEIYFVFNKSASFMNGASQNDTLFQFQQCLLLCQWMLWEQTARPSVAVHVRTKSEETGGLKILAGDRPPVIGPEQAPVSLTKWRTPDPGWQTRDRHSSFWHSTV